MTCTTPIDDEAENKALLRRIHIPDKIINLTVYCSLVGGVAGLIRGGRATSLRFLVENAHRPPRSLQGWYFYRKTKNYRVIMGALQGAARDGGKLGLVGLTWAGIEEGFEYVGAGQVKEIGTGILTPSLMCLAYRAPWPLTKQLVGLGFMAGTVFKGLAMLPGIIGGEKIAQEELVRSGDDD